jgi:predicted nucleic acid-binding protein
VRPSVYVETTIVSYLVGWLNQNDLQVAAHQELTRRWWTTRRDEFELYASAAVIDEASDGDPVLAAERLQFLKALPLLRVTHEALDLKSELLRRTQIPGKAETDALHIAIAAVHGMEYLATWNCRHIANAVTLPLVYEVCRAEGYEPPLVCTPHELLGENDEEQI